jgi:hypothetical protein
LAHTKNLKISAEELPEQDYLKCLDQVAFVRDGLIDWQARLQIMNECGVDMHVLSITIPGVQLDYPSDAVPVDAAYDDGK